MFVGKLYSLFVKEISDKLKGVSVAYTEYYKALTFEKLVIVLSGISILIILFLAFNLFLLFIAIGLALYIGKLLGSFALGFVILGFAYLSFGLLMYAMRKKWIIGPIISVLQKIMYTDEGVFDKLVEEDTNPNDLNEEEVGDEG